MTDVEDRLALQMRRANLLMLHDRFPVHRVGMLRYQARHQPCQRLPRLVGEGKVLPFCHDNENQRKTRLILAILAALDLELLIDRRRKGSAEEIEDMFTE